MCQHRPQCPPADDPARTAARTVAFHPEQGWSRLCNGVIVFDDLGGLLPDGRAVAPHRRPPGPAATPVVAPTPALTPPAARVAAPAPVRVPAAA